MEKRINFEKQLPFQQERQFIHLALIMKYFSTEENSVAFELSALLFQELYAEIRTYALLGGNWIYEIFYPL